MKGVKRNNGCSRLKKSSKHPMNFGDTNLLVIDDIKPSHSITLTSREVLTPHQKEG